SALSSLSLHDALPIYPSAPSTAWVVSICNSNRNLPVGRPLSCSSREHSQTMASTCSTDVTFGSVITNPSGSSLNRSKPWSGCVRSEEHTSELQSPDHL